MIFFNQDDLASNHELFEITDPQRLAAIRADFRRACPDIPDSKSPQICGTVVASDARHVDPSAAVSAASFERKMLMMRADIFTLLSSSMVKRIMRNEKSAFKVQRGCMLLLEAETGTEATRDRVRRNKRFDDRINGWNHVLHHRCTESELIDAKKINYQS